MAAITVAEFIKDLPETTVVGSKKKKWGVYFFNSDQDGPKFLRGYGSTGAQDILPETCEVAHIPGLKVLKEVVKKPLEGFVVFAGGKPAAIALTESDAGSEADKLGVECEIFPFSGTYEVEVNG